MTMLYNDDRRDNYGKYIITASANFGGGQRESIRDTGKARNKPVSGGKYAYQANHNHKGDSVWGKDEQFRVFGRGSGKRSEGDNGIWGHGSDGRGCTDAVRL